MNTFPRRVNRVISAHLGHNLDFNFQSLLEERTIFILTAEGKRIPVECKSDLVYPTDSVVVQDQTLPVPVDLIYAYHKPTDVLCDHKGPAEKQYFRDIAMKINDSCFLTTIGRLDYKTSGLIFLTTSIMGPIRELICSSKVHKTYVAGVSTILDDEEIEKRIKMLMEGIQLDEGVARFSKVEIVKCEPHKGRARWLDFECTINQGWNRIVRRMFCNVGLWLTTLHRKRIGSLDLGRLDLEEEGSFKALDGDELNQLYEDIGGIDGVIQGRLEALERRAIEQNDERLKEFISNFNQNEI